MHMTRCLPWMHQVHREMHRLFDECASTAPGCTCPPLNLWEDSNNLYVDAELPGLQLDKLEILVADGNRLTIQGERSAPEVPEGTWHRRERRFGKFHRTLDLPVEVQADKVEARFEHGVLRVTLPKAERVKPRRIPVTGEEN